MKISSFLPVLKILDSSPVVFQNAVDLHIVLLLTWKLIIAKNFILFKKIANPHEQNDER